jgi:branched-chain amino acid transport system permease protein
VNQIQLLADAVSLGSIYALVALGIGLIFGVMRMINFAHGDLIMLGAYALVLPTAADFAPPLIGAWPAVAMIAAIIAIVAFAALLTERFAFRPLRRREVDGATLPNIFVRNQLLVAEHRALRPHRSPQVGQHFPGAHAAS